MNIRAWGTTESSRLAIAALCAVAMHVSLACLPVQWRPILPTPTVLRVTLAPPAPTPEPPVAQPITPVATVAAVTESSVQTTPSLSPEPPVQSLASARPPTPPKVVQPSPKPKRPPEPRKPPPIVQPVPTPPKPKPPKPIEQPRVIVAKTPPKESAQRAEQRSRPFVAKTITPQATESESGNDGGRTARSYRKAWDDDFDAAPSAGRFGDRMNKTVAGGSGTSAAATPAPPARVATLATSLRPLPGNPKPRYPEQLRQRGIEGQVLVRLTVSSAGSVESASVARSSGNELLDQEARATVLRWRFQPLEGPKVAQLPITFRLQN